VTASAGLERLKRSPFGIGPQPLIARAPSCVGCEPPQPLVRTVTGVRVGLAFAPLVEPGDPGQALLVPVLLFDVEEGGTLQVLAVADEFLPKPVDHAKPLPEPGPRPIEPATAPAPPTTPTLPQSGPAASRSADGAPR